jgi:TRAP-type C4-dicarboxylate transport system permease large subunit
VHGAGCGDVVAGEGLKWKTTMHIDNKSSFYNNEVRYMHNYLQTQHELERQKAETERLKQRETFQRRINLVAWFFGLPILLLSFLNVIGEKSTSIAAITMVGSLAIGLIAYFTINYLTNKRRKD